MILGKKLLIGVLLWIGTATPAAAQTYLVRDIKSFGARGDGRTNDHDAFEKAAAFFNARGGRGKLTISKGTYIVGKQIPGGGRANKAAYEGRDVLYFASLTGFVLEGAPGAVVKYAPGLRYGAFHPQTGKARVGGGGFIQGDWGAFLGHCVYLKDCRDVQVRNLALDGASHTLVIGGGYGDGGRQLSHYGIFIDGGSDITVEGVTVQRFALDGTCVAHRDGARSSNIRFRSSTFTGNGRQGLSWIGGRGLRVTGCTFSRSGQGPIHSPPGAGVDIEAEWSPIRDGLFEGCTFADNKGCALVADAGDSGYCTFKGCTFWGVENWSIWVTKPGFTFERCKVYGSVVHGYGAPDARSATRFRQCHFEDKLYNGREVYGGYLVESNNIKRMSFEDCTFVSNRKKLVWIFAPLSYKPEEKYQFTGCTFTSNNSNLGQGDFVAVIRGMRIKNCTFRFAWKDAKKKGYYFNDCCDPYNVDLGGNSLRFADYTES